MIPSFITLCCIFCTFQSLINPAFAQVDTIKSLPRIDKEFQIVLHIIADSTGKLVNRKPELENTLITVNEMFSPIGVSFTVCETREIENLNYDIYYDTTGKEQTDNYNIPDRINVYIHSAVILNGDAFCGLASIEGISQYRSAVFLSSSCLTPGTVAHEFGHFFGLAHTFEGSGNELADGSNCKVAGDEICDTPADPFIFGDDAENYVNDDCVFFYTEKDANGDFYDPDVSNIMSYYPCKCLAFTRGQYEYMVKTYYKNPHMW